MQDSERKKSMEEGKGEKRKKEKAGKRDEERK